MVHHWLDRCCECGRHLRLPQRTLLALALVGSPALCAGATDDFEAMTARIEAQMQVTDRHRFDAASDNARKPALTFRFLGVSEGMTALDVGAYAGYTTEMLSAAVGPTGKVYSHNRERVLTHFADGYYQRTMDERLANGRLPNVVMHLREYDALGLEGTVDVAFLGNLLHDFYHRDGRELALAFLRSIHAALKPGGVLGVADHVGVPGANNKRLHRLDPRIARGLIEEAGFVIEAESDLYANPQDDHTLLVYNDAIYLRTDRFLFRARKPPD